MSWTSNPFNINALSVTNVNTGFDAINENFVSIANAFVNNDPTTGIVKNANTLNGFRPSINPAANAIPVSSLAGLNSGWIQSSAFADELIPTYSLLTAGTSFPTSYKHNDMFFNTNTNTLYKFNASNGSWMQIPWQILIKSTPDWANGNLKIDANNNLWIRSNQNANWYRCIPAVGSEVVELATLDNTNFTYLYYIAPGQQAIVRNSIYFPIVFSLPAQYFVEAQFYGNSNTYIYPIIYPNNTAVTTYFSEIYQNDSSVDAGNGTLNGHTVGEIDSNNGMDYSPSTFTIRFDTTGNTWSEGVKKCFFSNYGIHVFTNYSNLSNAYWLGVVYSLTYGGGYGLSITMVYASILRTV